MTRIAIGGIVHESNTFRSEVTELAPFVDGGFWPPLQRGPEMFRTFKGTNIPIAGAIRFFGMSGHEAIPLVWAAACPSGTVSQSAYETLAGLLIDDLAQVLPVDGVYLDLHGALVAEHVDDGDGELLRRVRDLIGPHVPLVASLDMHSNTSAAMVHNADALIAFRTYPHVDMAETGERAARELILLLSSSSPRYKAFRRIPFLIGAPWQCTLIDPGRLIFDYMKQLISVEVPLLSFTTGFPAADVEDCGPTIIAYGERQESVDDVADKLQALIVSSEPGFQGRVYTGREAVQEAIRISVGANRPIIIADAQDNPGGGAPADTVGILKELIDLRARGAVVGIVCDADAVRCAHNVGTGARLRIQLGAKSPESVETPIDETFLVEALGDGNFLATGPMFGGSQMNLGPMALLAYEGVRIAVSSRPFQAADQAAFRHLGVEPAREKILVLKDSVHFRADFQDLAEIILIAASPGALPVDPSTLPFTKLQPNMRLRPLGPVFSKEPISARTRDEQRHGTYRTRQSPETTDRQG